MPPDLSARVTAVVAEVQEHLEHAGGPLDGEEEAGGDGEVGDLGMADMTVEETDGADVVASDEASGSGGDGDGGETAHDGHDAGSSEGRSENADDLDANTNDPAANDDRSEVPAAAEEADPASPPLPATAGIDQADLDAATLRADAAEAMAAEARHRVGDLEVALDAARDRLAELENENDQLAGHNSWLKFYTLCLPFKLQGKGAHNNVLAQVCWCGSVVAVVGLGKGGRGDA